MARRVAPKRDILATAQVFAGAAIYAAWLLAIGTGIWWMGGRTVALVVMLLVPILALALFLPSNANPQCSTRFVRGGFFAGHTAIPANVYAGGDPSSPISWTM